MHQMVEVNLKRLLLAIILVMPPACFLLI